MEFMNEVLAIYNSSMLNLCSVLTALVG